MFLFDSFVNCKVDHWDNTGKCVTVVNAGGLIGQWRSAKNCDINLSPYMCKMVAQRTDASTMSEITTIEPRTTNTSVLETTSTALSSNQETIGGTFSKNKSIFVFHENDQKSCNQEVFYQQVKL